MWFTQIYAEKDADWGFWGTFSGWGAAEVCSAEATELPVWKRPPVSVANGLCHPRALDHGSQAVMTQNVVCMALFQNRVVVSKDWIPGQACACRDDMVYSLMVLVSGAPFHLQRSCHPRSIITSSRHHLTTSKHLSTHINLCESGGSENSYERKPHG